MKELNILYTCDNNFLDMTSISMESVVRNNDNCHINFYLATEADNHIKLNKIKNHYKNNSNISVYWLDLKGYDFMLERKDFPKWGSSSYYVYWKMFAYDLIDKDYVIYLDSDVICLSKIELPIFSNDKCIGMCLDTIHTYYYKISGLNEKYHFYNSGSMFVNTKKWKDNNCLKKILNYIDLMNNKPLMCDQDIISGALQDDIELISPKFNYLSCYDHYGIDKCFAIYSLDKRSFYSKKEIQIDKDKVVFYHCLGGECGRPWDIPNTNPIKNEYNVYRKTSAFSDFSQKRKNNFLFKLQKITHLFPDCIYNLIHNRAIIFRLCLLKIFNSNKNRSM